MNPTIIHAVSIVAAVAGVFVSNYATRRPGRLVYWAATVLTIVFCIVCFLEVGWMGLFLAVFSPNVTDILNSIRSNGGGK
jgi:hypothetical protein